MQRMSKELEDEDDGWKHWIKSEGEKGVPWFKQKIVDWLAAPIEWGEDMPDIATASGSAMRFFKNQDLAILDKLGVWIVEGGLPSTYCAAELDKPVGQANKIAPARKPERSQSKVDVVEAPDANPTCGA
jgi:hypothetical protein